MLTVLIIFLQLLRNFNSSHNVPKLPQALHSDGVPNSGKYDV